MVPNYFQCTQRPRQQPCRPPPSSRATLAAQRHRAVLLPTVIRVSRPRHITLMYGNDNSPNCVTDYYDQTMKDHQNLWDI